MRWEKLRRSQNIENRRGQRMARRPAAAGGGCSIILLLVLALIFKVNPLELLSEGGLESDQQSSQHQSATESGEMNDYVAAVLGSTEQEWAHIFRQYNRSYRTANLINYSGSTHMKSGGIAKAATGPFYVPTCLLYTSPRPRDQRGSRMPSSA